MWRNYLSTDFINIAETPTIGELIDRVRAGEAEFLLSKEARSDNWLVTWVTDELLDTLGQVPRARNATNVLRDLGVLEATPTADVDIGGVLELMHGHQVVLDSSQSVAGLVRSGAEPDILHVGGPKHDPIESNTVQGGGPGPLGDMLPIPELSEPEEPAAYWWVTELPEDRNALDRRVLFTGSTYQLSTRFTDVEPVEGDPAVTSTLDGSLVGSKVRFTVRATGMGVRKADDTRAPFAETARSDRLLVELYGTDPFLADLRPEAAGMATVHVELDVDGAPLDTAHDLTFTVVDAGGGEPAPAVQLAEKPTARQAVVWLRTKDHDQQQRTLVEYGGLDEEPVTFPTRSSEHDIGALLSKLRIELDELAMAYATFKPGADDVLFLAASEKAMTDIANIGRRVHRALFGKPGDGEADANTRAVAGSIAALGTPESAVEPGARMSIEDDGMPFPWGMVYDGDYLTPAGAQRDLMAEQVIPEGFWGHRFTIDRLVRRYGATRAKAQVGGDEVRVRSIVNPTVGTGVLIDGRVTVLPASAAAVAPITSGEALLQWLDAEEGPGEAELVYFYCHGFAAATLDNSGFKKMRTSGEQAVLGIDESETGKVSVQQLRDAAGHPSGNPVVFLTACSAGGGDPGFPSPFATLFIRGWDGRSLVAADAKVPSVFGKAFSAAVLADFFQGDLQLGDALAGTVRRLLDVGNPFGLYFGLHGRPEVYIRRAE